ncbi:MAG: hypothetical protein LGR52_11355, partial [Candidatus Thiosymbion ectosymbiont of Robbea hypermnestra]|nr:hypothetical protein [Candidatus Thiosymbion ectosymbiont of Robbea hypermnestra]
RLFDPPLPGPLPVGEGALAAISEVSNAGGVLDLWFPGFGVEASLHHYCCPRITPIFTDYRVFSSARIGIIRGFKHHRSQNYNTILLILKIL